MSDPLTEDVRFLRTVPSEGVLEDTSTSSYNGVWKLWKWGSLGLFGIFVATFVDVALTLRRIERGR